MDFRLLIFGFDENLHHPDEKPVTTLINPWLEVLTDETEDGWEGVSQSAVFAVWCRAIHIRYRDTLEDGTERIREARGFHARVFQHEFDNLSDVLHRQRIQDMTQFGFIEALFPDWPLAALEADA
ncbi:MAG: peptide deformylase [Asticcacaulis sp.]|uniref:peptide deformylase n=1 Tax=Asticcacaulis sp. TaxID=1872648 RepID=UPI0039E6B9F3